MTLKKARRVNAHGKHVTGKKMIGAANQAGGGILWDSDYEKVSKQLAINAINKTALNSFFNNKEYQDKYKDLIYNYLYNILIRFYKYHGNKTIKKNNTSAINDAKGIQLKRAFSLTIHKTDTLNATTKRKLYKIVSKDKANQPHYDELSKYFSEFVSFLLNSSGIQTVNSSDDAYTAAKNSSDNMESPTSSHPYYSYGQVQTKNCKYDTCYLRPFLYKLQQQQPKGVSFYCLFGEIQPNETKREIESVLYDFIRTVRTRFDKSLTNNARYQAKNAIPERISNMKLALDNHAHALYYFICYMYNKAASSSYNRGGYYR